MEDLDGIDSFEGEIGVPGIMSLALFLLFVVLQTTYPLLHIVTC